MNNIKELTETVRKHAYLYYVKDAPEITDEEYDILYDNLVSIELAYPHLADPNSPTKRVGSELDGRFKKDVHLKRMLSLAKVKTAKEIVGFFKPETVIAIEPKIDGLSLKLFYEKGVLVKALTRGNGREGDVVTVNARTITTIPLTLPSPLDLEVTGEVYMRKSVFNQLNAALEEGGFEVFTQARNAASGSLKMKNPAEVAVRKLSFVAHGCSSQFDGISGYDGLTDMLRVLGFVTSYTLPITDKSNSDRPFLLYTVGSEQAMEGILIELDHYRRRLDLDTDGLVLKINNLAVQDELGEGEKSPNWAVAYKYPPEVKASTLNNIVWQVGRTGKVTPVAEIKPILLSGAQVSRVGLCNADEIKRLGSPVPGDIVHVMRSNDIIPKIVRVTKNMAEEYVPPTVCPCCQSPLDIKPGRVDAYCVGDDCVEKIIAKLAYATGKACLDFKDCGESMLKEFVTRGARKLSDLYAFKDLSFLMPAARERFISAREASKKQPLYRKLNALGIENVGTKLCQDIASSFSSLNSIFEDPEVSKPKLLSILKESAYDSFVKYLEENEAEILALEAAGVLFEDEVSADMVLRGKSFVITGALATGSRNEAIALINRYGGTVAGSVSKTTSYVIKGAEPGGTKLAKAEKYGIKVIAEEGLYAMIGITVPKGSLADIDSVEAF